MKAIFMKTFTPIAMMSMLVMLTLCIVDGDIYGTSGYFTALLWSLLALYAISINKRKDVMLNSYRKMLDESHGWIRKSNAQSKRQRTTSHQTPTPNMTSVNTQAQQKPEQKAFEQRMVSPKFLEIVHATASGRAMLGDKQLCYEDGSPLYANLQDEIPAEYWITRNRAIMDEDGERSVIEVKLGRIFLTQKYPELLKVVMFTSIVKMPPIYVGSVESLNMFFEHIGLNGAWHMRARIK